MHLNPVWGMRGLFLTLTNKRFWRGTKILSRNRQHGCRITACICSKTITAKEQNPLTCQGNSKIYTAACNTVERVQNIEIIRSCPAVEKSALTSRCSAQFKSQQDSLWRSLRVKVFLKRIEECSVKRGFPICSFTRQSTGCVIGWAQFFSCNFTWGMSSSDSVVC